MARDGMWMLLLLVAGCRPFPKHRDTTSDAPHIFLIVIDTLRLDRLGVYGRTPSLTPSIDQFAKDAMVYPRAYAPSSWTKTSVASLLTGLHPYRHHVFEESIQDGKLPKSAVTIAERLKQRGYKTLAVSVNPHVSKQSGFHQGFDKFIHQSTWTKETNEFATQSVIQHLAASNRGLPQFVYLHYLDPHDPWPRRRQCKRFLLNPKLEIHNDHILQGRAFNLSGESRIKHLSGSNQIPIPVHLSADELEYLKSLYGCEVALVDREIGKLLAFLKKNEWLKKAIVIITADHGEELLEHGLLRHGYQLFDETTHVPLIIGTFPAAKFEKPTSKQVVSLVDIPATIYESVGITTKPGEIDGKALFGKKPSTKREINDRAFGMTQFRKQHKAYLIVGQVKIIHDFNSGKCAIYHLDKDPVEKRPSDCAASPEGRQLLSSLIALKTDSIARAIKKSGSVAPMALDNVVTEQLKELGYVQ